MQDVIKKRLGSKYSATAIEYLKREVNGGRYFTSDVKIWIVDQGYTDSMITEVTNLRYRLMKYFPIKGWDASKFSKEVIGGMQDSLFNGGLEKEVTDEGQQSVDNSEIVHNGLKQHVKGYGFRNHN